MKWLIVWRKGRRMGSVPLTAEALGEFLAEFYMHLIQRDAAGHEHWAADAVRKRRKRR